jgi:tripartite-type tricarboxylate transporter receptor subunit TctC
MAALRGGQIDLMIEILGPLSAQFKSKTMRPLATMGERRNPQLKDVPTVHESGGTLAGFNATSWNGFAAPAKTPKDVIAKLNTAIQKALKNPEVIDHLALLSLQAQGSTPEQLGELLAFDTKRWGEVITHAKIAKQ